MITIDSIRPTDKKVLVRCDFDVPLNKNGEVVETFRLEKSLPTINYLLGNKAKVILTAHLGRPAGKAVEKESLRPVAEKLGELLKRRVDLVKDLNEIEITSRLAEGGIVLLENLRFNLGEEKNEPEFARKLSSLADLYVNDAFGASHRNHASIVEVTKYLPSYGGLTLSAEIETLSKALKSPQRPLVAIIGGAKIETKLPAIKNLAKVADHILVGGKLLEEKVPEVEKIIFPEDVITAKKFKGDFQEVVLKNRNQVRFGESILDIGLKARGYFSGHILKAGTIIWNGPMGLFEDDRFAAGTKAVAKAVATSSGKSIVGGGETIESLRKFGLIDNIDHVSTGGGAMLEFLAGKKLPGIEALEKRRFYETIDCS